MIQGFVTELLEPLITDAVTRAVRSSLKPEDNYCTVADAMAMLHCSQATIYRRHACGELDFYKMGGKTLLLKEQVRNLAQKKATWRLAPKK